MTPDRKAREIAGISPKAKIDDQPFEARIAYYSALKMYEWANQQVTERAKKWVDSNIVNDSLNKYSLKKAMPL
jgi:rhamnogalacturonyl hydrolase YesR